MSSPWRGLPTSRGLRNLVVTGAAAATNATLGATLAPYPAWCTFATALNASIAQRN